MEIELVDRGEKDYEFWQNSKNENIKLKISELLKDISRNPESGLGKPERLKYNMSGYWSRRINREHRLVYKINYQKNTVYIFSLKGHYEK